jgi:anti-anti-sigma factor
MLTVYKQIDHHTTVLALTGPLDEQATLGLETFIQGAKELRCRHIILDLSAITLIGSFALGQLVRWHNQMKPQDLHFSLVNPSPSLRETLNQPHLSDLVPIFASQEEAIKHHEAFSW